MTAAKHCLLICTVGGAPEPVIAAIRHWEPARVLLVHSLETKPTFETITKTPGLLPPGAWDTIELHDAQDFGDCVYRLRCLDQQIDTWRRKGTEYEVIVDFTGGTKCMSAAISLVARRSPCKFSYVGGTERTQGGIGIVVSGKEQTRFTQNPWNALGYQAIEDACLLFDQQAFTPAASLLDEARKAADDEAVKRRLSTFHQLCEGYGLWDRFQHKAAASRIDNVLKHAVDLQETLANCHDTVIRRIRQHRQDLRTLVDQPVSLATVKDLLANARRRKREGRYDDGVARLYRAIESIAQRTLAECHEIPDTSKVALERIPETLREHWASRAEEGELRLGLQEAFTLLNEFRHPAGAAFFELGLHDQRSPLTARNQSILAHGFQAVGPEVFDKLWSAALKLGGVEADALTEFPHLTKATDQQPATVGASHRC